MFNVCSLRLLGFIFIFLINSCATHKKENNNKKISKASLLELDKNFEEIVQKHNINTAGVAIIKSGQVVWQNYYGQQSPNVPASAETLFNVASLTKTVTAETILCLINQGKLSLDEPMSDYWVDPDLKDVPASQKLTPRMALTHTTGFMNWRFFAKDFKLKFINEPGTEFEYSGEGFEYLAKYAEKKLEQPFEQLVKTYVFRPLKMDNAFISVNKNNFQRIAKPLDKNGKFYGYYCYPHGYCKKEGDVSAAGDMVITVDDYAKFLISSMNNKTLGKKLLNKRNTIQSVQVKRKDIDCSQAPDALCPTLIGYGLGWNINQLDSDKLIGHRGSDWSTVSLAYYYEGSKDGLIIFFNAPNKAGIAGMIDALQLLDPRSPELHGYKLRLAR